MLYWAHTYIYIQIHIHIACTKIPIQWLGFNTSWSTWEPLRHLDKCQRKIEQFYRDRRREQVCSIGATGNDHSNDSDEESTHTVTNADAANTGAILANSAGGGIQVRMGAQCAVCNGKAMCAEDLDEDPMVQCNTCQLYTHLACYRVELGTIGSSSSSSAEERKRNRSRKNNAGSSTVSTWTCDTCKPENHGMAVSCIYCPVKCGLFKQTDMGHGMSQRWAHVTCSTWLPGPFFSEGEDRIMDTNINFPSLNPKARLNLACQICNLKKVGLCIQCTQKRCKKAFHVECARLAGFPLEIHEDESKFICPAQKCVQCACIYLHSVNIVLCVCISTCVYLCV